MNARECDTTGKAQRLTITGALALGAERLGAAGVPDVTADLEYFLTGLLGCARHALYTDGGRVLTETERRAFFDYLERRGKREPVQHISGAVEFFGREFRVTASTLIPRPETELLVEAALREAKRFPGPGLTIIDLCTGSGCVATTLALELAGIQGLKVYATDISTAALDSAHENARVLGADKCMSLVAGDLFAPLSAKGITAHIITANPPYVPTSEITGLEPEVRDFEPALALDGGPDGLDAVRRIITDAPAYLAPGGSVVMEIGYGQAEEVAELVRKSGAYVAPELKKDFSGIERIVVFRLKG